MDLVHCNDDNGQKRVATINSAAPDPLPISSNPNCLAESLQKTIVQGWTVVASELLRLVLYLLQRYSVPKHQQISCFTNYCKQCTLFCSNLLRLACTNANVCVLRTLLCCSYSGVCVPKVSRTFPIHLVCVERRCDCDGNHNNKQNRVNCIHHLLSNATVPLTVLEGSKQTLLHAAGELFFL